MEAGLATACRMNAQAIKAAGFETVENDFPKSLLHPNRCTVRYDTNYFHFQPDHWNFPTNLLEQLMEGRRNIAYWAWETSRVPPLYLEWTKRLHQVWVPSRFVADALSGAHCPVHVVPHAIDVPEKIAETQGSKFRVLFCFDGKSRVARKNPFAVIRAFQEAFPDNADVELVIKAHALSLETMDALLAMSCHDPRIKPLCEYMEAQELEALYSGSRVFLSLHRGEGFGLHLAEAMARRLVVVATDWGGQLDFLKDGYNGFTVPCQLSTVHDAYYGRFPSQWAQPCIPKAADVLRFLRRHWGEEKIEEIRDNARHDVLRNLSREALIKRIQQLLS